jgi:hypothetical protein
VIALLLAGCALRSPPSPSALGQDRSEASSTNGSTGPTIAVLCDKTEYKRGELIVVSVVVTNGTPREMSVPNGRILYGYVPTCIRTEAIDDTNTVYGPIAPPGVAPRPPLGEDFSTLKPGETLTIIFKIIPPSWGSKSGKFGSRAGDHVIRCQFLNRYDSYYDATFQQRTKLSDVWIGETDWSTSVVALR